ncbi:HTRA2-related serine protease [Cotesia typhae]|uniref:HTRA2-related serine protease n=1 Tax=Cotesia typhae TaxID=2053667 RepID=UPI003D691A22
MASFLCKLLFTISKNKFIRPISVISQNYSLTHLIKKHYHHDNNHCETSKLIRKFNLTYAVSLGLFGLAYGIYKCSDSDSDSVKNAKKNFDKYYNLLIPKVFAKSDSSDISDNRSKYNFIADVVQTSLPSVVYIEIKDQTRHDFFKGYPATTSNGSGFIVSEDGLILTNAHVVLVKKPGVLVKVRLQDGSTYTGKVENVDLHTDLATVRINKKNLPVMKLGSSSDIRLGEFVVAIGSPLALSNTITSGIVSGNRQSEELGLDHKHMRYIQTDAPITFGNSGGPLVNLNGEAIGINAMKVTPGISFAIPIDYAKEFLRKVQLHNKDNAGAENNTEHDKRRYVGITMLSLTPDILSELQQRNSNIPINIRHGVLVWKVTLGSPAHTGGLRTGDIITHVNDEPVVGVANVYKAIEKPGALIMTVLRNGETLKLLVEPEDV